MTEKYIFEREGDNVYYRDFGAPANSRQLITNFSKQEEFEFMKDDGDGLLDIIQNDIYDTASIIKQDTKWLARLRVIADDLDSDEVRQIADRFEKLTNSAHNRKHWTGHE